MVEIQNINLSNIPINGEEVIITTQKHAIGFFESFLALAVFVFLAYWYITVSKNKAKYEAWSNPNGRVVNLYKLVRRMFWVYVAMVIILGALQIITLA